MDSPIRVSRPDYLSGLRPRLDRDPMSLMTKAPRIGRNHPVDGL